MKVANPFGSGFHGDAEPCWTLCAHKSKDAIQETGETKKGLPGLCCARSSEVLICFTLRLETALGWSFRSHAGVGQLASEDHDGAV